MRLFSLLLGLTNRVTGIGLILTCNAVVKRLSDDVLQVLQLDLFSVPPSLPVLQHYLVDHILACSAAEFEGDLKKKPKNL